MNNNTLTTEENLKKILEIIDHRKLTAYQIAKETGISQAGLGKIINGQSVKLQKKTINKLLNYLVKNETTENNISLDEHPEVLHSIKVPYYDVDFSGGWKSDEMFSESMPSYNISSPDFSRAEFACNLVGNSISRRIPSRAIIGLKEINDWQTYFPTNEIYALVMKNNLRTVKIVKRGADGKTLILIPDPLNEFNQTQYEQEVVPIDFVYKFFQVVAWGQFEKIAM